PVVDVKWDPPTDWNNEPFRVYARRQGGGSFFLIATVTSCTSNGCVYRDRNVSPATAYEYYVATVNEDANVETTTADRVTARVPTITTPATPQIDSAVALDNAAYIRWHDGGNGQNIWKYIVYLTRIDSNTYLYGLGETDGRALVDTRAANGHVYGYRIAAVDTSEVVSSLSPEVTVVPRPDASGELIYSFQTNPTQSGFRFQTSESTNPIVDGGSATAQWRLEHTAAGWKIVPLNGTSVVEYGGRTTALVCGPGADADCRAATRAPAAGYVTTPITVNPEFSYIFRVTGSDGQPHFGVIRASILGSDGAGHDLMIFDWAYQLIANDVRLDRTGG
ncbi:MAG TPA: fibronectin type III domain-containing protein, partial [Longimicrobiaceae bacterium]